jgi:hypothetical protein
MRTEQRNQIILVALVVVLGGAIYEVWPRPVVSSAQASAPAPKRGAERKLPTPPSPTAPAVHLDALNAERPKPGETERNLFRFKAKAAPRPQPAPVAPAPTPVAMPTGPPPPPPVPPIQLKFIGIVEATEHSQRIAVLSDEHGVYHGREGDIIEGRYRVIRVGVESVELIYVDGRGRQTIRLSGS